MATSEVERLRVMLEVEVGPAVGEYARESLRLKLDALVAAAIDERDQAWVDTVTAERLGRTDTSLTTQILMDMHFCVRDGKWVKRDA